MSTREKPNKPYPDFPLTPHKNGQWCKKIQGKIRYFGVWENWQAALKEYEDSLEDGRHEIGDMTLADLCNYFLRSKLDAVNAGELREDTYKEYGRTCSRTLKILGKLVAVEDLTPQHFEMLRTEFAKMFDSPATLRNNIARLRAMFAWAYDVGHVDKPLRFRGALKRPSLKTMRKSKASQPRKLFKPEEIRRMIDAATGYIKPAIHLAINAGLGNTDVCELEWEHIEGNWMLYERPKTGVEREAWLWPETIKAMKDFANSYPDSYFVCCGMQGQHLGEGESCSTPIGHVFRDTMTKAGVDVEEDDDGNTVAKFAGRAFYALRHTYRTIADEQGDQPAILRTMGHADNSISGGYRATISRKRLKAVSEHVRAWLFELAD